MGLYGSQGLGISVQRERLVILKMTGVLKTSCGASSLATEKSEANPATCPKENAWRSEVCRTIAVLASCSFGSLLWAYFGGPGKP